MNLLRCGIAGRLSQEAVAAFGAAKEVAPPGVVGMVTRRRIDRHPAYRITRDLSGCAVVKFDGGSRCVHQKIYSLTAGKPQKHIGASCVDY